MHLLRRLREETEQLVCTPLFRRKQEQAIAVPAAVPLVVTEGTYLLADDASPWHAGCETGQWFVDVDPVLRRQWLIARHVATDRSLEEAERWVSSSDEPKAVLVAATRDRADLVIRLA